MYSVRAFVVLRDTLGESDNCSRFSISKRISSPLAGRLHRSCWYQIACQVSFWMTRRISSWIQPRADGLANLCQQFRTLVSAGGAAWVVIVVLKSHGDLATPVPRPMRTWDAAKETAHASGKQHDTKIVFAGFWRLNAVMSLIPCRISTCGKFSKPSPATAGTGSARSASRLRSFDQSRSAGKPAGTGSWRHRKLQTRAEGPEGIRAGRRE